MGKGRDVAALRPRREILEAQPTAHFAGGQRTRQQAAGTAGKENRGNLPGASCSSRTTEDAKLFPDGFCLSSMASPEVPTNAGQTVVRYGPEGGRRDGCSSADDSDSSADSLDTDDALEWLSGDEAGSPASDQGSAELSCSQSTQAEASERPGQHTSSPDAFLEATRPQPQAAEDPESTATDDAPSSRRARGGHVLQRLGEYEAARLAEAAAKARPARQAAPRTKKVSQRMQNLINITADALSRPQTSEPGHFAETIDQICDPGGPSEVSLAGFKFFHKQDRAQKEESFKRLAQAVGGSTSLTSLNLSATMANDFLAEQLAVCLAGNNALAKLNLETNDLTGRGLAALARLVHSGEAAGLRELRLVNQLRLCPARVQQAMASAVKANSNIVVCSMDCRDAAAREALESALSRNIDARRLARLRKNAAGTPRPEPRQKG